MDIYINIKEKLIKRILDTSTPEASIANTIYRLLDGDSTFDGKEIKDFLYDKILFDKAKKEIYDILTEEHQKSFDMAERILRGNKKEEKAERKEEYAEFLGEADTHDLFLGFKQWVKYGEKFQTSFESLEFFIHWTVVENLIIFDVKKEIQEKGGERPSDKEIEVYIETAFSEEAFKEYDILTLSTLIINSLKRYAKALGLPYLPEYVRWNKDDKEPHQDSLNANMNTTSVIMGIPMTQEHWKEIFSKASCEFMMIKSDLFNLLMYHFEIDTPEKMNEITNYFGQYFGNIPISQVLYDLRYTTQKISQYLEKSQSDDIREFISEMLRQEFGIKNISIESLKTMRSTIQNYRIYLTNLNEYDNRDKKLLKFFLGLQLHKRRKDFKIGKKIDFSTLFEKEMIEELSKYIHKMKKYPLLKAYNETTRLKIQEDVISQRQIVKPITTTEIEVSSLQQDLQDLLDPDNFSDQLTLFNLLNTYKKGVGNTLALIYRKQPLSIQCQGIQGKLEQEFGPLTSENIVKLEKSEKIISIIINFVNKMQSTSVSLKEFKRAFSDMQKQLSFGTPSPLLLERIQGIEKKLSTPNETTILTTKMTNDFNIIIPNIRGCLQCIDKNKGGSNYHNLTFGDPNKFFMAVYGVDEEKTVADAIVDIFPYQEKNSECNENKLAFVVERVYGERTPDVLFSILQTIQKKQIEAGVSNIDIFVSKEALDSSNTTLQHLQEEFKMEALSREKELNIKRTSSPSGYGHYEFSNNGILIKKNFNN